MKRRKIVDESIFSNLSFDVLLGILVELEPSDILELCKTSSGMADLCRDERMFQRLLPIHFAPDEHDWMEVGMTWKQKYVLATRSRMHTYLLKLAVSGNCWIPMGKLTLLYKGGEGEHTEELHQLFDQLRAENQAAMVVFSNRPLLPGFNGWLAAISTGDVDDFGSTQLFNTRAEAVEDLYNVRKRLHRTVRSLTKLHIPEGNYNAYTLGRLAEQHRLLLETVDNQFLTSYEKQNGLATLQQHDVLLSRNGCLGMRIRGTWHVARGREHLCPATNCPT